MEHVSPYEPKISVHHVIDGDRHCSHHGTCQKGLLMTGWRTWRKVIIPDGRYMIVKDEVIGTCWPEETYLGENRCPWCLSLNSLNTVLDGREDGQIFIGGAFQIEDFGKSLAHFGVTAAAAASSIQSFAKTISSIS